MSGPLTTNCEKVFKSCPFKRKVKKEPNQIIIKPKVMTKDMFISNILTAEIIIRCEMLRDKMSYK